MQGLQYEARSVQVNSLEGEIAEQEITKEKDNKGIIYYFLKRFMDILLCSLAIIAAVPIIIIACAAVVIESEGLPIFKQERLGKNGNPFMLYKIRSMYNNAEEKCGAKWAEKNDPRVTKVGKFIRKTRIDELPQLLNIIKGDMSIVGPRPEREAFYDKFEKGIAPGYRRRLLIKPGLTGYAQINGGYDLSPQEKLRLDMKYINDKSLLEDFKIIIKTTCIVINGNGAR
jgi:lipopolysaccharide/colanic/teichoic acid biosynthesis glycosyltransferase